MYKWLKKTAPVGIFGLNFHGGFCPEPVLAKHSVFSCGIPTNERLPCCSSQPLLGVGGEAAADDAAAISTARRLCEDDLVVDVVKINYGKGDRNPVDSVVFYGRDDVSVVRKRISSCKRHFVLIKTHHF